VAAVGSTAPPNDYGMVASIDGCELRVLTSTRVKLIFSQVSMKLTPLRLANVPPPMALHTVVLERPALDVAVSKSGSRLAVLSDNDLAVYALDMISRPIPKPTLLWRSDAIKTHCPRHVVFVADEQIFVLVDSWEEDVSTLWRSENEKLILQGPFVDAEAVSSLLTTMDYTRLCAQGQNGALHEIDLAATARGASSQTSLVHKFPSLASEVKIIAHGEQVCSGKLSRDLATDQTSS
jgi:elongator complex protein 1